MAKNPETVVTNRIRKLIEAAGGHFVKLSDTFTRGVPDAMVVTDRVVMVEFKVDRLKGDPTLRSYKSLGMTGAQDHHIRHIARRTNVKGSCVITDTKDGGKLRLWVPVDPGMEGDNYAVYAVLRTGWGGAADWLNLLQT